MDKPVRPADEVTPDRAAEMLGIALALVYQRMDSGKLPFRQAGDDRLIRVVDIEALQPLEARRQALAAAMSADTEGLEADFSEMPAFSLENYELRRDADETDESTQPGAPSFRRRVQHHEPRQRQ